MTIQPEIKILVGVPCSGKSTWVNDYLSKEDDGREWVVLSVDDIIEAKCRHAGIAYREGFLRFAKEATRLFDFVFEWAVTNHHNIIVDQTNLTPLTRRKILAKVSSDYKKSAINFETDADTIQQRLHSIARQNKIIPRDVLNRMQRKLVFASAREGFDNITSIKTTGNTLNASCNPMAHDPNWPIAAYELELSRALENAARGSLDGDDILVGLYLGKAQKYASELRKDITSQIVSIRQNLTQDRIVDKLQRVLNLRLQQARDTAVKGNQPLTAYYLSSARNIADRLASFKILVDINEKSREIVNLFSEHNIRQFHETQIRENLSEAEINAEAGNEDATEYHIKAAQQAIDKLSDFLDSLATYEIQIQTIRSKLTGPNKEKYLLSKIEELLASAESAGRLRDIKLQYSYVREAVTYATKLRLDISEQITRIIGMPYQEYASKLNAISLLS